MNLTGFVACCGKELHSLNLFLTTSVCFDLFQWFISFEALLGLVRQLEFTVRRGKVSVLNDTKITRCG